MSNTAEATVTCYDIDGLCCATEERLIRNGLKNVAGVRALDFDLLNRRLTVTHELADPEPIRAALSDIGMAPSAPSAEGSATGEAGRDGLAREWLVLGMAGAFALAAELVGWLGAYELLSMALAVTAIVLGGRDTLRKGLAALRTRTLNINLLMIIAVLGALAIGHWPEAAMVTVLFAIAEAVEEHALDRARNAIRGLMALAPETATLRAADGSWRSVPVAEVPVGALLRVLPGERLPLDGKVTAGESAVNQAPITGESVPVAKAPGDPVFAGTINEEGPLEVRVTAAAGATTLDRIIQGIQEAQARRAPTQRFIDEFARYYTPAVVLGAALMAVVPPLAGWMTWYDAVYRALVLLVIACPCALVISTPVTVVSGLTHAARRGLLVKGGVYLEEGRRITVVALDKTGTLTRGRPQVLATVPLNGVPPAEALRLAASLNVHSRHPVALAIVAAWRAEHPDAGPNDLGLASATEVKTLAGRGVTGRLDGTTYFVGNHRLAEELTTCSPAVEATLARLEQAGQSTVVLGSEREPVAVFGVADALKDTSAEAIAALHALGLRTVLLTGDNDVTARAIADAVGIDDVRANLLPEDKLAAVDELLEQHRAVGMVGDGINDGPALARATIGFAMGAAGSDTAIETADVALMDDDLRKLPEFLTLSRRTGHILAQNIILALGIKGVFFALVLAGSATLWMAVFADMGASLLVVFNGLRLLRK